MKNEWSQVFTQKFKIKNITKAQQIQSLEEELIKAWKIIDKIKKLIK